jgi:hypothetical protein
LTLIFEDDILLFVAEKKATEQASKNIFLKKLLTLTCENVMIVKSPKTTKHFDL